MDPKMQPLITERGARSASSLGARLPGAATAWSQHQRGTPLAGPCTPLPVLVSSPAAFLRVIFRISEDGMGDPHRAPTLCPPGGQARTAVHGQGWGAAEAHWPGVECRRVGVRGTPAGIVVLGWAELPVLGARGGRCHGPPGDPSHPGLPASRPRRGGGRPRAALWRVRPPSVRSGSA